MILTTSAVSSVDSRWRNEARRSLSALSALGRGVMETVVEWSGPRRKVICVAKRVHTSCARGKEKPVRLSSSELLPEDCPPTTTIWTRLRVRRPA